MGEVQEQQKGSAPAAHGKRAWQTPLVERHDVSAAVKGTGVLGGDGNSRQGLGIPVS
jgi:hypothetical protein